MTVICSCLHLIIPSINERNSFEYTNRFLFFSRDKWKWNLTRYYWAHQSKEQFDASHLNTNISGSCTDSTAYIHNTKKKKITTKKVATGDQNQITLHEIIQSWFNWIKYHMSWGGKKSITMQIKLKSSSINLPLEEYHCFNFTFTEYLMGFLLFFIDMKAYLTGLSFFVASAQWKSGIPNHK